MIVNLFLSAFVPRISRWNLTRHIQVYQEPPHGIYARVRVFNGGFWTMGQAIGYLSLEITPDDVIAPPAGNDAFIKPETFIPLAEDQLCWSVRAPGKNPIKVDIFAKEKQPLALCAIDGDIIMIPSEEGWAPAENRPRVARVFLRRRAYFGCLKIVSADTNAKYFQIEIHPENTEMPLVIRQFRLWEKKKRGLV